MMLAEAATLIGLAGSVWGGYRYFIATKLRAHVAEYAGVARLTVTNDGKHTALLQRLIVHRPKDSTISEHDHIVAYIIGSRGVNGRPEKPAPRQKVLKIDMEVAPGETATYDFRFFAFSSATVCRIKLEAWESSLIAKTRTIVIPITPKAITVIQKSDT